MKLNETITRNYIGTVVYLLVFVYVFYIYSTGNHYGGLNKILISVMILTGALTILNLGLALWLGLIQRGKNHNKDSQLHMEKNTLEGRIIASVSNLTPEQVREVRLLCEDLMREVRGQCLSITQDAVNRIVNIK